MKLTLSDMHDVEYEYAVNEGVCGTVVVQLSSYIRRCKEKTLMVRSLAIPKTLFIQKTKELLQELEDD